MGKSGLVKEERASVGKMEKVEMSLELEGMSVGVAQDGWMQRNEGRKGKDGVDGPEIRLC